MLPQFQHPADFHFDCFDDFLAAVGLAFWEFEHLFVVDKFCQLFLFYFNILLVFFYFLEAAFNSCIEEVEFFSLEVKLHEFQVLFKFLYFFFGFASFDGLGSIDFLFDFGSHKGDSFVFLHQLVDLLHFIIFLLVVSLFECFQSFLNSVKSQVDVISPFIKTFQRGHDLQEIINFGCDIFVSGVDVFLGGVQEF